MQSSSWASQAFPGSIRKGSGPLQSIVQTTTPNSSFSPLAVRGFQLCSRHHSLQAATHETSAALPHYSVVHGVTTIVLSSGTQRNALSPLLVVVGRLTHRVPLTSPKTSSTLCTDSSTMGWGATLDALEPLPGPSVVRHRCPEHRLGHPSLSVPLPTIAHPSGGFAEGEAVRQHIPCHCPSLASPVMVPRLNQFFRGSSPPTAGRSSGSGPSQEVLGSPKPGLVKIPCLAVVREHLQTAGFSARTADRIALPQSDFTGRLYNAKCQEFCHWCHRRKADPV